MKKQPVKKQKSVFRKMLCAFFILLAIGLIFLRLSDEYKGATETVEVSSLPVYGSDAQNSMNGWVQFSAVSVKAVGQLTERSEVKLSSGSKGYIHYIHDLYLIKDSSGNTVLYDSVSTRYEVLGQLSDPESAAVIPGTLYGRLDTPAEKLSGLKGYDTIASLRSYPLLTGTKETSITLSRQTSAEKSTRSTLLTVGAIFLVLAAAVIWLMSGGQTHPGDW